MQRVPAFTWDPPGESFGIRRGFPATLETDLSLTVDGVRRPWDLSSRTVRVSIARWDSDAAAWVPMVQRASATIVNAPAGRVRYIIADTSAYVDGEYGVQWDVLNGADVVGSVPTEGNSFMRAVCGPDLGSVVAP